MEGREDRRVGGSERWGGAGVMAEVETMMEVKDECRNNGGFGEGGGKFIGEDRVGIGQKGGSDENLTLTEVVELVATENTAMFPVGCR